MLEEENRLQNNKESIKVRFHQEFWIFQRIVQRISTLFVKDEKLEPDTWQRFSQATKHILKTFERIFALEYYTNLFWYSEYSKINTIYRLQVHENKAMIPVSLNLESIQSSLDRIWVFLFVTCTTNWTDGKGIK